MQPNAVWRMILAASLAVAAAGTCVAKPYTPADDGAVLERLPEKNEPALAELKRMRAALRANPGSLDIALRVTKRSIEAARATGDPRFLGQAQAALSPWWTATDPPHPALLLRATLKQSQHDFAGALADLDRLLTARPADGQALLTRATVLTVQGRYTEAQRDCERLARLTTGLVTAVCRGVARSLNGDADGAYRGVTEALSGPNEAAGVRIWASTLAAEIAARRGDASAADAHFRAALALDPRDPYLLGAYADFLLDQRRARDVVPMLTDFTRNDALLLRLALAEKSLPEQATAFDAHRRELADRFAAARMRGDTLHLREEARYRLEIDGDARAALALAEANWKVQKEPADLRILAAAARAGNDAAARMVVTDWIAATHLEDVTVVAPAGGRTS